MGNMSYCMFRNTLEDLRDCKDAMDFDDLSEILQEEDRARRMLIVLCTDIAKEYGEDV